MVAKPKHISLAPNMGFTPGTSSKTRVSTLTDNTSRWECTDDSFREETYFSMNGRSNSTVLYGRNGNTILCRFQVPEPTVCFQCLRNTVACKINRLFFVGHIHVIGFVTSRNGETNDLRPIYLALNMCLDGLNVTFDPYLLSFNDDQDLLVSC